VAVPSADRPDANVGVVMTETIERVMVVTARRCSAWQRAVRTPRVDRIVLPG